LCRPKPLLFVMYRPVDAAPQQWNDLHRITSTGDAASIRNLLDNRANVNAKCIFNFTPLHITADFGHEKATRTLLEHKANANSCDCSGRTPLHIAATNGNAPIVAMLIAYGGDANARSTFDAVTPKEVARLSGHKAVVKLINYIECDDKTPARWKILPRHDPLKGLPNSIRTALQDSENVASCTFGCQAAGIKRKDLKRHLHECQQRPIPCPYACGAIVRANEMMDHYLVCTVISSSVTSQNSNKASLTNDMCAICLDAQSSAQVALRALDCGHTFHLACIQHWLSRASTCPLCKQPVVNVAADHGNLGDSSILSL